MASFERKTYWHSHTHTSHVAEKGHDRRLTFNFKFSFQAVATTADPLPNGSQSVSTVRILYDWRREECARGLGSSLLYWCLKSGRFNCDIKMKDILGKWEFTMQLFNLPLLGVVGNKISEMQYSWLSLPTVKCIERGTNNPSLRKEPPFGPRLFHKHSTVLSWLFSIYLRLHVPTLLVCYGGS